MNSTQVFADENVSRVSLRDARAAMLAAAAPLPSEEIFLAAARGRTLAHMVRANEDLIPFARSAMVRRLSGRSDCVPTRLAAVVEATFTIGSRVDVDVLDWERVAFGSPSA
jgi:molybdopterin biosynthesis enzyme